MNIGLLFQIRKSDEKTPSKKRTRKSAAEDDGSDGSEKASDSESPVEEEIEQKRLTFKDETDHEGDSMVEEKKQASNSSTAIKVVLYGWCLFQWWIFYFDDSEVSIRSRAC